MQLPGEFSPFIEKSGFLLSGRGGYPPPTPLVVRPLKKNFFMCVFPKLEHISYSSIPLKAGGERGGRGIPLRIQISTCFITVRSG